MKDKKAFLLLCATLSAFVPAFAQDTEDKTIPAEKPSAERTISIKLPDVPAVDVKVSAFTQVQFVTSHSSGSNEASKSGFSIRRANIGVSAKLDDNWSARLSYEFDSKDTGGSVGNGYIDKALIEYKNAAGTLQVGCRKVNFMLEEYTSCLGSYCLENSIGTSYIVGGKGPVGLAGRHLGTYWEGKVENVNYGVSITNAVGNDYDKRSNNYAFCGNIGYTLELEKGTKLLFALNSTFNYGDEKAVGANTNRGFVYGFEPYVKFTNGGLNATLEGFYVDGEESAQLTRTFGVNATVAYKLENGFEPVARIAYVNTHNGDLDASVVKNISASGIHPYATGYYIGANYYLNKYIKISAAYEYIHLFGGNGEDDSNGFRVQLQASF